MRFRPSSAHSHFQIETKGDSDTCLELFRDRAGARAEEPLATDDDSGDGLNARLSQPFGYASPLYVKLETCGRTRGKVRLVSRRSLQKPAKCNSGGCVFAATLQSRPEERELLAVLRQVRELLQTTPEGRRLRDLYWDISVELVDDVVLDPRLPLARNSH